MTEFLFEKYEYYQGMIERVKDLENDPIMKNTHDFYDMTREETMVDQCKRVRRAFEKDRKKYFFDKSEKDYFHWTFDV